MIVVILQKLFWTFSREIYSVITHLQQLENNFVPYNESLNIFSLHLAVFE